MNPVVFIQHEEHITPGTLGRALQAQGVPFQVVRLDLGEALPSLQEVSGIVSLGGTMSVNDEARYPWIPGECRLLRAAIEADLPVAGLCLGGQLIAKAYGKPVVRSTVEEVGWHEIQLTREGREDPVMRVLGATSPVFHWHNETFSELPPGAVLLAESPDCRNQAYRIRQKTYGFQFHPEMDCMEVDRWLDLEETDFQESRTVQSKATQRAQGKKAEHKSLKLIEALSTLFRKSP